MGNSFSSGRERKNRKIKPISVRHLESRPLQIIYEEEDERRRLQNASTIISSKQDLKFIDVNCLEREQERHTSPQEAVVGQVIAPISDEPPVVKGDDDVKVDILEAGPEIENQTESAQCFIENMRLEKELETAKETIATLEAMAEFCKYHHVNQISRTFPYSPSPLAQAQAQTISNPNSLLPPRYPTQLYTPPEEPAMPIMSHKSQQQPHFNLATISMYQKSVAKLESQLAQAQQSQETAIVKYQTKIAKLRTSNKTIRMESAVKTFEMEQEIFSLKKQIERLGSPPQLDLMEKGDFESRLESQSSIATLMSQDSNTAAGTSSEDGKVPPLPSKSDLQKQQDRLAEMTRSLMARINPPQ